MRPHPLSPPLRRVDPPRRHRLIPATQTATPGAHGRVTPPAFILPIQHFSLPTVAGSSFIDKPRMRSIKEARTPPLRVSRRLSLIDPLPCLSATRAFQPQSQLFKALPVASPTPSAISTSYRFSHTVRSVNLSLSLLSSLFSVHPCSLSF